MRLHLFHRWSKQWAHVIRRDLQGGEFWTKECSVCGHVKIADTQPRWFL